MGDPSYKHILGIDVRRPRPDAPAVQYAHIDLTEPAADQKLTLEFQQAEIDTVVHLAYLSRPVHQQAWAHELETIGTLYVLNACAAAGVRRVIALSTTMCYGAHPKNPGLLTEDQPLRGAAGSRWITDKVDAEGQLAAHALAYPDSTVTVLRLAPTVGPRIDNYWTRVLRRPLVNTLMGFDPPMQFLHEDDALAALELAVDQTPGGCFNIAPPGVVSLCGALELVQTRALPMPAPLGRAVLQALWTAQINMTPPAFLDYLRYVWLADGSRARSTLGFQAQHSTRDTLLDFAAAMHRQREHLASPAGSPAPEAP